MARLLSILVFATLLALVLASPRRELSLEDEDIVLRLYTRQNPTDYQLLESGNYNNLDASNFDISKPVKFFSNGRYAPWETPDLVEAFLTAGDVNVILVDWTKINQSQNETYLVESAKQTGRVVSGFLDWISTLYSDFSFSNVHITGFSIGCHAAAYQARFCENGVVEYLTGLDCPFSDYQLGDDHISPTDAKYVEVFHTSYGGGNSFPNPLGIADFYPNGGAEQPGCDGSGCSHGRATQLFIESIVSDQFVSIKCNNFEETVNGTCAGPEKAIMGGTGSAKTISGIFYLTTNAESPFAKGDIY